MKMNLKEMKMNLKKNENEFERNENQYETFNFRKQTLAFQKNKHWHFKKTNIGISNKMSCITFYLNDFVRNVLC